jgi:hypothetical protein
MTAPRSAARTAGRASHAWAGVTGSRRSTSTTASGPRSSGLGALILGCLSLAVLVCGRRLGHETSALESPVA